jgi:3-deoxy-D-manno-octulosonate 8-phosphate phosphatase (KDO 8-P phosphatase)
MTVPFSCGVIVGTVPFVRVRMKWEERGEWRNRAKGIRLVGFDVDGVLTPGNLIYGASGEELKVFNVRDGWGIKRLNEKGFVTGIITGRCSPMVEKRAGDLNIPHVFQGIKDKWPVLEALCGRLGIEMEAVAYMGDDVPDLEILRKVGLAACPRDAIREVRRVCHFVAPHEGGFGAARDLCDGLLEGIK